MQRIGIFFLTLVLAILTAVNVDSISAQSAQRTSHVNNARQIDVRLPKQDGSLKLAVFGDAGRGSEPQYELAALMADYHEVFPFNTVLLTGDNIYGSERPKDMKKKFEDPYRTLLECGVKFYASLGNHDSSSQRFYALFNMNGREYYRIERSGVSFYALDSTDLDEEQLNWLTDELRMDLNQWRIAFFHHPPFSSGGRHGSDNKVRRLLHSLFVRNGIDAVFNGHDHFYERIRPQDGITYFISGAAGKIRKGDIEEGSMLTAAGFDTDLSFMLVEFAEGKMHFQAVSRTGAVVDSGFVAQRD